MTSPNDELWGCFLSEDVGEFSRLLPLCSQRDVNKKRGHERYTLLISACQRPTATSLPFISLLAQDLRVNVNATIQDGWTALSVACFGNFPEAVRILLGRADIDVTLATRATTTPWLVACSMGHHEVVRVLMQDPRVNVNDLKKSEFSGLCLGCQNGCLEVVRLLAADPRVNLNQPEKNGCTPFYVACQTQHAQEARILIDNPGVDLNRELGDGHTPLAIVCGFDAPDILEYWIASGRPVACATPIKVEITATLSPVGTWLAFLQSFGKPEVTPREIAERKGHLACLELLDGFRDNPRETRFACWRKLHLLGLAITYYH